MSHFDAHLFIWDDMYMQIARKKHQLTGTTRSSCFICVGNLICRGPLKETLSNKDISRFRILLLTYRIIVCSQEIIETLMAWLS